MRRESDPMRHVPVMCARILELLHPAWNTDPIHLDLTLGMGGHALAALRQHPALRVIGVDRDPQALLRAQERIDAAGVGERFVGVRSLYDRVTQVLAEAGRYWGHEIASVQSVLADLGVSSLQLDESQRGFSYAQDAPLDMRMDPTSGASAAEVLQTYPKQQLARILCEYGDERYAGRIAAAIVQRREHQPLQRSGDLVKLIEAVTPVQRSGGHPAKRSFQALRIEVNQELASWARALPAAIDHLDLGGRITVLSYHSGEDRITKRELVAGAHSSTPLGLPVELPHQAPYLRLLTRGAERPELAEQHDNPRSASARLRAAERIALPSRMEPGT